jgi:competence protein ComEC
MSLSITQSLRPSRLPPAPLLWVLSGAILGILLEDGLEHLPLPRSWHPILWGTLLLLGLQPLLPSLQRQTLQRRIRQTLGILIQPALAQRLFPRPSCLSRLSPSHRSAALSSSSSSLPTSTGPRSRGFVFSSGLALFALLHHHTDCTSPSRPPSLPPLPSPSPPGSLGVFTLQGLVDATPSNRDGFRGLPRCEFPLTLSSSQPPLLPKGAHVLAVWTGPPPAHGDQVELRASVHPFAGARNPGQPNPAQRHRRERLWLEAETFHSLDAQILQQGQPPAWSRFGSNCRRFFEAQLGRGLESQPKIHALLSSMILGLPSGGLREWRDLFRNTGTLHLFAVSGLNLTLLSGLLGGALRFSPLSLSERPRTLLLTAAALLYGLATGLSTSCVRALVMTALALGTVLVCKPVSMLNSLGAAGLLLLTCNTNNLFDWGFQLSFALVLILSLLSPPIQRLLVRPALPDPLLPRSLWSPVQKCVLQIGTSTAQACAVTVAAWLGSLPWAIFAFEQISPAGLIANLVAGPIAFLNMALGFAALVCAPLGPITPWLNQINATGARALLSCLRWSNQLPGASVTLPPWSPPPTLAVLDLQGAPCVLLQTGSQFHLLDCGSRYQTQTVVLPALREFGVRHLSSLILCRPASESIGGTLDLLEQIPVLTLLDSPLKSPSRTRREIHEWLSALRRSIHTVRAGDRLDLGGQSSLEVLYPPAPPSSPGTVLPQAPLADDKGLILRFRSPDFTLLYTGCAGFPTEQWLLQHRASQLAADIWVRGWHSREMTGSPEFLAAVRPRTIIVSAPPSRGSVRRVLAPGSSLGDPVVFEQAVTGAVLGQRRENRFELKACLSPTRTDWPLPIPANSNHPP